MDAQIQTVAELIPELRGKTLEVKTLGGGLTNRNYRVKAGNEVYALRIAGTGTSLLGIHRAREVACQRAAAAAGVGPGVVAFLPEQSAILTEFCPGHTLTVEDFGDAALLSRVGQTLRRCHNAPVADDLGAFSPFATVRSYHQLAKEKQVPLPVALAPALERLAAIERELTTAEPPCLCHNDLLAGNFIDDGTRLQIIDWEYGGLGDRFFDLGNLAVNLQLDADQERNLLTAYWGEARVQHLRRLRLMRLVSDMREAMWGFLQAGVSQLHPPQYYLDYGLKHLKRFTEAPPA